MTVNLRVNDMQISAEVTPRTHLADFLRDALLLTGTHVGCEHGVCGACTVLIDGEPARSCITFAANCEGHEVRSIEGLQDDPVVSALRDAFKAEHALQCGYCTPGMLVTARDIVLRLPEADEDRIRLELAGNLCRCTGYNGIVRAIRRVLAARPEVSAMRCEPVKAGRFGQFTVDATPSVSAANMDASPEGNGLHQSLRIGLAADEVWPALRNPALIASCLPGAKITSFEDNRITGEMLVALGPIQARFTGSADLTYDDNARTGCVIGEGRDGASGTRLSAKADFGLAANGANASVIDIHVSYSLKGPLAQFGRGPIVRVFAAELAATVARNLEARLRGEEVSADARPMRAGGFILRAAWRWLRDLLSPKHVR